MITKQQYKQALSAEGVLRDGNVELLNYLFFAPQCAASAPEVAEALGYGRATGPANANVGFLGKRIASFLGIELPERGTGGPGWWRAIAEDGTTSDGFAWKLREELADALIELGLLQDSPESIFPDVIEHEPSLIEGHACEVKVNRYERNPVARKLCIKHYGPKCRVCDFDFSAKYGEIGQGFIHVHHIREISTVGSSYRVDPIDDLRPVCPNCHAMLHMRRPAFSIEGMKDIVGASAYPTQAADI